MLRMRARHLQQRTRIFGLRGHSVCAGYVWTNSLNLGRGGNVHTLPRRYLCCLVRNRNLLGDALSGRNLLVGRHGRHVCFVCLVLNLLRRAVFDHLWFHSLPRHPL